MNADKITVVVPVYNCEKYLDECVSSILNQTYKNIEIILVDDGSTDSSGSICDSFCDRYANIKVIHMENKGVSSARNAGIEASAGEWITFVDSDDYVDPNMCEYAYQSAAASGCDVVMWNITKHESDAVYDLKPIKEEKRKFSKEEYDKLYQMVLTGKTPTGDTPISVRGPYCKLIKKEIAQQCRFPQSLSFSEDWCFMLQILEHSKTLFYINENFYHYIVRKNSLCNHFDYDYYKKIYKFINWINDYITKLHSSDKNIMEYIRLMNTNYLIRMIDYYMFLVRDISEKERFDYINKYISQTGFGADKLDPSSITDKKSRLKVILYQKKLHPLISLWRTYQTVKISAVLKKANK